MGSNGILHGLVPRLRKGGHPLLVGVGAVDGFVNAVNGGQIHQMDPVVSLFHALMDDGIVFSPFFQGDGIQVVGFAFLAHNDGTHPDLCIGGGTFFRESSISR